MNSIRLTVFVLACCFASLTAAQENGELPTDSYQDFGWKPFTLEFNTTNFAYGLSLEKYFNKRLAARVVLASDLKFLSLGNKITMGCFVDVLKIKNTSLRTGVEMGIKQRPEPAFFLARVTRAVVELPVLVEFQILKNISINLGNVSSFNRYLGFAGFQAKIQFELFDSYHVGLRYTFSD